MTHALRILHVVSGDLWAGAEVQAFTLIRHLSRMPDTEVAAVLMNNGELAHRLRSSAIPVSLVDEQSGGFLGNFIGIRATLQRWQPDVLHTHRQKENILGSLANRTCRNVVSVRTVHGGNEHSGLTGLRAARRRSVNALDRWCGRVLQQRVIAVTRELGAHLTEHFPASKIAVIENGVDAAEVRAERGEAEFRRAEPDAVHIGIAGRLAEVKRVDLFIDMAALLLREHPQRRWQFHVFGEGPARTQLEVLAERARTSNRVIFHGHRQDMATCLGGLDALVICSDHEGMPMVALEAAVLGVPTVAHAVGGLVDVVPAEFLVVRHDALGYADGILRALCEDGADIASRHSREVVRRFSAQRNAERIRALYEQVMAERSAPIELEE